MSENKYEFSKASFDRLNQQLHDIGNIRERLSSMTCGRHIGDITEKELINRIIDAVTCFDEVNKTIGDSSIDTALDSVLDSTAQKAGISNEEMLRRLDCALDVFTNPVKLQLFEGGMTDTEFFNKYNELHGDRIPAEALRESVASSAKKLNISAFQLKHAFSGAADASGVYEDAFELARDNFNTKCIVAMHIYLENRDMTPEAAAVVAGTQVEIRNITRAKYRGDIFEKYADYLFKAVIIAAFVAICALSVYYGGFFAFLAVFGKYLTATLGISIITPALTGLSALTSLLFLGAGISFLPKKLGNAIARETYFDATAVDNIETVEPERVLSDKEGEAEKEQQRNMQ